MRLIATALVAPVLVGAGLVVTAAPAYADEVPCVREMPGDTVPHTEVDPGADADDATLAALGLERVHRIATGAGVGIAVIDSGVQRSPQLRVADGAELVQGAIVDGHGTIVAGLIGGSAPATGIAPGATLYDVRVAVGEPGDSVAPTGVRPADVAAGVRWATQNRDQVQVIHLSVGFDRPDDELAAAIRDAVDAGVVVVAAAGNRPPPPPTAGDEDEASSEPDPAPDEVLFPATMPEVIAVTSRDASMSVAAGQVLLGPEIDVSAPVVGLRSVMLRGVLCTVTTPASTWAAAQVSGLVALLLEQDPSLTPAQVRTRIAVTAQGGMSDSASDGHGMIQPYDALTRVLSIAPDGTIGSSRPAGPGDYLAAEPQRPTDRYADQRRTLLWWGTGAAGLLVLSLLLRPLLSRRD